MNWYNPLSETIFTYQSDVWEQEYSETKIPYKQRSDDISMETQTFRWGGGRETIETHCKTDALKTMKTNKQNDEAIILNLSHFLQVWQSNITQ